MSNTQNEFKNENVTVIVDRQPGAHIKMDIAVAPQAVQAAYARALKSINKEITLPGFRKGKAPDKYIEEKYGKQVEQEWREVVIQTSFQEALTLTRLRPIRNGDARCSSLPELSKEAGARLTIEFEMSPEVPLINLSRIILKNTARPPVTQADIDRVIENIRTHLAKWVEIADRPVQEGDYVDLDIDKLDEPVESICQDTRFTVTKGKMADWMYDLILNKNIHDSVEGMSERSSDEPPEAQEAFKPTHCRITIKSIKTAELPEINDELAHKIGAANLADLNEKIAADLNQRADREVHERLCHQVDEILLEQYHFEIPKSILQEEMNARKANAVAWLEKQGAPQDVIHQRKQEMDAKLPEEVERSYRLFFLIHMFARQHNIIVTKEETAAELSHQIMQGMAPSFEGRSAEEIHSRLGEQLLLRKSRDFIIGHVLRQ